MSEIEKGLVWQGWKIVRMIGRGSFGCVYEVEKEDDFGRIAPSALKVISIPERDTDIDEYRQEGYDDISLTALFKSHVEDITSEFRLMSKLKGCSNIVSFEDYSIVQHTNDPGFDIYIRMELLTTLMKAYEWELSENGYSDDYVQRVGIDICRALERCAKHNIVHRDIKPQNIFINEEGDFKLGDFGIAKTADHTTRATKTGTYNYMAPEVYWGKPYNASVDIYSLGLVLYWMMNERRGPFMPLPPALPKPIQNAEALELRMQGNALSSPKNGCDELKKIVLKACAYDPKDRYASPLEMRHDLERITMARIMPETSTDMFSPERCNVSYADDRKAGTFHSNQENLYKGIDDTAYTASTRNNKVIVNNEQTIGMLSRKDESSSKQDIESTLYLFSKKGETQKPEPKEDNAKTISKNSSKQEEKAEKHALSKNAAHANRKKKNLLIALTAILVVTIAGIVIGVLGRKNKLAEQLEVQPTSVPTEVMSSISSVVPATEAIKTSEPTPEPTFSPEPTSTPKPTAVFQDATFENAFRAKYGFTGTIYQSDILKIQKLDLSMCELTDISDIAQFHNLTSLELSHNQISDIQALSGLTNLEFLSLGFNQISDIQALSGLTNLSSLSLEGNQISNISALSGLTSLKFLYLNNNQISNISALSGLTNLTSLSLGNNQISDISNIAQFHNLTSLELGINQISDIQALSGLASLEDLYLNNNQISDIQALSRLTSLEFLWLYNNQISDITGLGGLTKLICLDLGNNQIRDITALSGLTKLTRLNLGYNQISDITALSGLARLEYLDLGKNQITDITSLSGLTKLTTLYYE